MSEFVYEGRCWKFGDNIPTDRLVKSQYVLSPLAEIAGHVLEDLNPRFPLDVAPSDIVVAGKHFGQSSGRAIAVKGLQATRIGCVVADSFARTMYRNCFEIGLPALEVPRVTDMVSDADRIKVDLIQGTVENLTTGAVATGMPAAPFLMRMLAAGGLIDLVKSDPNWSKFD